MRTARTDRESIRREAKALRDASLALQPLTFPERRRVLVMILDRLCVDGKKLGSVDNDGMWTGVGS